MGKIMYKNNSYSGSGSSTNGLVGTELTQAEYDALPQEEKENGLYFITDGSLEDSGTFRLIDTINYSGSFISTASTNRLSTRYLTANVDKISSNAFATLEHTINKDWFMMSIVSIDRVNMGVWLNFYNYYSDELSGDVIIKIYDIA